MSFVTFLKEGYKPFVEQIEIDRMKDPHPSKDHRKFEDGIPSFEPVFPYKFLYGMWISNPSNRKYERVITLHFPAVEKIVKTWDRIALAATLMSWGFAAWICWRKIGSQPLLSKSNLPSALGAVTFAVLARLADAIKANGTKEIHKVVSKINECRKSMIMGNDNHGDQRLSVALQPKFAEFFMRDEMVYAFDRLLLSYPPSSVNEKILDACLAFQVTHSDVKLEQQRRFQAWVRENTTLLVDELFNPENFESEQEKKWANAFKACYEEEIENGLSISIDALNNATTRIEQRILDKRNSNPKEAIEYVSNNALNDFHEALFLPESIFKDKVEEIRNQMMGASSRSALANVGYQATLKSTNLETWVEERFKTIQDEHIREIFLQGWKRNR